MDRIINFIGIIILSVMVGNGVVWVFANILLAGLAVANTPLSGCEVLSAADCTVFAQEGR